MKELLKMAIVIFDSPFTATEPYFGTKIMIYELSMKKSPKIAYQSIK